jgi:hypothetical protein
MQSPMKAADPRHCRGDRAASRPPGIAISHANAGEHFGWLAGFLAIASPASSLLTHEPLGW